ncbi:MAG: bifunctional ornithine acetyltransferase/N-acetylglutamate synthase [Lachnospiraceae bacterium]|nr:bifunctional ornithine acetyltransferase/N-acetylglutamate synthase [Lachnospiraceae bacterium]
MDIIDGGITAPKGFLAAGRHIGVKKVKKDLSLVESESLAEAAGVFTQSAVKAAPVLWDMELMEKGYKIKGIVTVSGNANACTGKQGKLDNEAVAETFAKCMGTSKENVFTAATGVIGEPMPMETIKNGILSTYPFLGKGYVASKDAAAGIITTDTFLKEIAVEINIGGKSVKIGAMAKGSGMIHPNMATVLAFITTDASISGKLLNKALKSAVYETYNMISVDGVTSTNDMALILANGMAGNQKIAEENKDYEKFYEAVLYVNKKLATDIVKDGEGASKMLKVNVFGAKDKETARVLAKSVVSNNLVKVALFGEDANWGRVLAAMGGSGANFDSEIIDIVYKNEKGEIALMKNGSPVGFDEKAASEILKQPEITIQINLNCGDASASAYGCDLGYKYIKINGEYRSRR